MFHMLTCFNLEPGISIEEFKKSLDALTDRMVDLGLLHATGPVGRRQRHPVMDTDAERDHEFFFMMSFTDREQCDRAVEHMLPRSGSDDALHRATYENVKDPIFICWEDIEQG